MSQKQDKKIRQIYRKDYRKHLYTLFAKLIKPKPRFIPQWLWEAWIGTFIKLDK